MASNRPFLDKLRRSAHLGAALLETTARRPSSPVKLNLCLTYWCQYRCKTCNIWQRKPSDELTTAEVMAFVRENPTITWADLTGGEIFLRPDIDEILEGVITGWRRLAILHFPTNGFLTERDFPALQSAASKLAESKIFIDDTPGLSILELRATSRRLKSQYDIQAIFIDYLQLLRSTSRRAQDNRQLEIAEISSGIKGLAKELNIPIVVLAQLNRNPESRSGDSKGRPRLSDLRESGSIEQDADVVGLLVREEYYADTDEEKEAASGKATLILAKQRNGPVGDVPLTFLKEFTRFENRAREADADE